MNQSNQINLSPSGTHNSAPKTHMTENDRFQNFLIQLKSLCDQYLFPAAEPAETPQKQVQKMKKPKKQKDPLAPKMPKSAFIFYFQDKREKFQQQYPDLKFQEITQLISREWQELPDEKKKHYQGQAESDRDRYQQEKNKYSTTNGKAGNGKSAQKALKSQQKQQEIKHEPNDPQDSFGPDIGQD